MSLAWVTVRASLFTEALQYAAAQGDLSEPQSMHDGLGTLMWYWSVNFGWVRPVARQDTRAGVVYYHLTDELYHAVSRHQGSPSDA